MTAPGALVPANDSVAAALRFSAVPASSPSSTTVRPPSCPTAGVEAAGVEESFDPLPQALSPMVTTAASENASIRWRLAFVIMGLRSVRRPGSKHST